MANDPKREEPTTIEDLEPEGDVKGGQANEKKKKTTTSDPQDYLKIELENVIITG
jgi:hypothetical protein